jgi:chemotaxis protein MotD
MAVREGGRELLVNLRPPDLGQLTIRVTMTDGVLHAQIMADRPEAARMLQQSLPQLDSALTDLGYSLDGLEVSYGGQDARDAHSSSPGTEAPARTEAGDDTEAAALAAASQTPATTSSSRLDLLA